MIVIVERLFQVLYVLLLVRVVLGWIPNVNYHHPAIHFIYRVTSLILDPIRRVVPPAGGFDLSPLVAILLLGLLRQVVMGVLVRTP